MLPILLALIACANPETCGNEADDDGDGFTDMDDADCWDRECIPVEECCVVCAPSQGVPCGDTCMELDTGEACPEVDTCGCSTSEICPID